MEELIELIEERTEENISLEQESIVIGLPKEYYYTKDEVDNKLNNYVLSSELGSFAYKNELNYNELINKPSIPTKTSDLLNDSNFTTKSYVDELVGNIDTILQSIDTGAGV